MENWESFSSSYSLNFLFFYIIPHLSLPVIAQSLTKANKKQTLQKLFDIDLRAAKCLQLISLEATGIIRHLMHFVVKQVFLRSCPVIWENAGNCWIFHFTLEEHLELISVSKRSQLQIIYISVYFTFHFFTFSVLQIACRLCI